MVLIVLAYFSVELRFLCVGVFGVQRIWIINSGGFGKWYLGLGLARSLVLLSWWPFFEAGFWMDGWMDGWIDGMVMVELAWYHDLNKGMKNVQSLIEWMNEWINVVSYMYKMTWHEMIWYDQTRQKCYYANERWTNSLHRSILYAVYLALIPVFIMMLAAEWPWVIYHLFLLYLLNWIVARVFYRYLRRAPCLGPN